SHGYFTVDLKEVWNTAKKDIPTLKMDVEKILSKKDPDENKD
ncbi:MAG: HepT-like ribonuclease domain-containing protein, partial [Promethearchaeota archaeon]